MKLFNNWNPINTLENLIYVAATFLMITFFVVKPLQNDIQRLELHIVQIAMQPRYSISNDFEKMRTKKNGNITLDLNNDLNHYELMPMDSLTAIDKVETRTFWEKLTGRNKD